MAEIKIDVQDESGNDMSSLLSNFVVSTFPVVSSILGQISIFPFKVLSYTITLTFSSNTLMLATAVLALLGYLLFRYRILTRYSRLPIPLHVNNTGTSFDLHPDAAVQDEPNGPESYQDELMGAFLSSIKVFGYLDRPVFHELARHLQTTKLKAGELLFDTNSRDRDFYVVVDGSVQVFVKNNNNLDPQYPLDDADLSGEDDEDEDFFDGPQSKRWPGHVLLNQVKSGGTVSSLFSILSVFTDDLGRYAKTEKTEPGSLESSFSRGQREFRPYNPPDFSLDKESPRKSTTTTTDHPPKTPDPTLKKSRVLSLSSENVFPGLRRSSADKHKKRGENSTPANATLVLEKMANAAALAADKDVDAPKNTTENPQKDNQEQNQQEQQPSSSNEPKKDTPEQELPNVHPDIIARASVDTTLAVIPAEAFQKLAEKFPSAAAGIVQVILIRFQRVTFNTLYRYLGLSRELLKIEKKVNEFTGAGLPANFFDGEWEEALERIKHKVGHYPTIQKTDSSSTSRKSKDGGKVESVTDSESVSNRSSNTKLNGGVQFPTAGNQSTRLPNLDTSLGRKERKKKENEYDADDSEDLNASPISPFSRTLMANNHANRESLTKLSNTNLSRNKLIFDEFNEDEIRLKQCSFDIITKLIGYDHEASSFNNSYPNSSPQISQLSHHMSPSLRPSSAPNHLHAKNSLGDLLNNTPPRKLSQRHQRRNSLDSNTEDDIPSSSTSPLSSSVSLFNDPASDMQILHLAPGEVMVREGERVDGLFFVIDGVLLASMKSRSKAPMRVSGDGQDDENEGGKKKKKRSLFMIREGGLAGYLSALTGHPSFITLRAKTDAIVAFLPKKILDRYVEKSPSILLTLAKRLINHLSPLVFHIDVALEWSHINAGQVVCRQNDRADSIFIVLSGRLRTILEGNPGASNSPTVPEFSKGDQVPFSETSSPTPQSRNKGKGSTGLMNSSLDALGGSIFPEATTDYPPSISSSYFEILGEHGQGESVGEVEVLNGTLRPGTVHAIRDTEVAIMPKTLFEALAIQHPKITIQISRIIASRANLAVQRKVSRPVPSADGIAEVEGGVLRNSNNLLKIDTTSTPYSNSTNSVVSAANNANLKTVAILPVHSLVPIAEFSEKLRESLTLLEAPSALLNTSTVMNRMGKHAFSRIGRLKLMSWLSEIEDRHRLVLYVADGGVNSPWTQRCVRQADYIMLVGIGDEDPSIGEYERLLIGMKTTARKELVLLHNSRHCVPGETSQWLKNRVWIHAHHHIQMSLKSTGQSQRKVPTISNLGSQFFARYYTEVRLLRLGKPTNTHTGLRSDFARLGRRLLSKSIGLVLGGGGARGIAHVGIIRAFEEVGIPVDMVGGTSIGAFVGGLYARENDHVNIFGRAKSFSYRMSSLWRKVLDITYPFTSLFTGHEFNRGIWKVFLDTHIEDCWLSFFCITTNITWSRMEAHRFGYMWRYIRASMSLSGYLPPLCDNGNMLLDGGYLNNLPADVMKIMGAETVIAVDVGSAEDNSEVNYGDSLSGWWVLFARMNPLAGYIGADVSKIPQMAEIQSRLAYVSSVKQLDEAKSIDGVLYLRPPVHVYGTLEFGKYQDIYEVGYEYGKKVVEIWEKEGVLEKRFGILKTDSFISRNRRASI